MTDFDDLLAKAEKATPGPWAWMGNNHDMYLATTHSGRRYVMGFRRMGTQSAQPVFNVNNRLVPASELVMFEVGDGAARGFKAGKADDSVYRYDIKGVDAPDAAYIAAASPDVIRALVLRLREAEAALRPFGEGNGHLFRFHPDWWSTLDGIECGQWRAAADYFAAHETPSDVTQAPLLNADDTQADTTEGGE